MVEQGRRLYAKRIRALALVAALISLCVSGAIARQTPPAANPAQQGGPSEAPEAPQSLHLLVGRSLVITSPTRIKRISLADPAVADALVVSPYQVVLNGKAPGVVSFLLWDESEQNQIFEVTVDLDILQLSAKLKEAFPAEPVTAEAAGDVVTVSGKVSSPEVAAKILELAKSATPKVTSLLQVPTVPVSEILLQVKFAEVDRTALSQFGVNILSLPGAKNIFSTSTQQYGPPSLVTSTTTTAASTTTSSSSVSGGFTVNDLLNVFLFRPDIDLAATIRALQSKNVLEILAEPNVLTASGKDAAFLAGGQFPYPVLQSTGGSGGTSGITISFKEFGVRLNFTPTVMADGLIHLKVAPEVSSLDFTNAVTISGFTIPALSTRRVESEMDLRDGQSFAIAGLVDNQVQTQLEKIPGIGDIPILGKLFQSTSKNKSRSELLVIVTPRIVQPMTADQLPTGPVFPEPFLEPAAPVAPKAPATK
jgi:pilus assembly protein CpaC